MNLTKNGYYDAEAKITRKTNDVDIFQSEDIVDFVFTKFGCFGMNFLQIILLYLALYLLKQRALWLSRQRSHRKCPLVNILMQVLHTYEFIRARLFKGHFFRQHRQHTKYSLFKYFLEKETLKFIWSSCFQLDL